MVGSFYISIDPSIVDLVPKILLQQMNSEETEFSILHRSSTPLSKVSFDSVLLELHLESVCFISTIPVYFNQSKIKVSKNYFLFISLSLF